MNKICTFFYSSGILIYLYLKYLFLGQFSINIRLCIIGKFSPSNLISISSQPCQTKPNPTAEKMFKNLPTSRELCFILYFIICTDKEPKSKQKSTLPLICEIGRIGWVAQKKTPVASRLFEGAPNRCSEKSRLRWVSDEDPAPFKIGVLLFPPSIVLMPCVCVCLFRCAVVPFCLCRCVCK